MVQSKKQTETTANSIISKMLEIYNSDYRERDENGEFQHPREIDEEISKRYYHKFIDSNYPLDYTIENFYDVMYTLSGVGEDSSFEDYYEEYKCSEWEESKILSEERYTNLLNIIFELGNK